MAVLRVAIVLIGLIRGTVAFADLTPKTLHGHVWIDVAPAGTFVRVDRAEKTLDGMIDEEFTLFHETATADETVEIHDAIVVVLPRSVVVRDRQTSRRHVLAIVDEPTSDADAQDDDVVVMKGYGIRNAILASGISRNELLGAPSWRHPETLAACDAGGSCGAVQCSIACGGGRECSVTCSGNKMACCICAGPNKTLPSCQCPYCT